MSDLYRLVYRALHIQLIGNEPLESFDTDWVAWNEPGGLGHYVTFTLMLPVISFAMGSILEEASKYSDLLARVLLLSLRSPENVPQENVYPVWCVLHSSTVSKIVL